MSKTIDKITLPYVSVGNEKILQVIRYVRTRSGKKVYIQAGLHADESPAFLVMHHLIKLFDQAEREKQLRAEIVLVPVANPIGLDQWSQDQLSGRFESASRINFNRDYPDLARDMDVSLEKTLTQDPAKNKRLIRKAAARALQKKTPVDAGGHLKKTLVSLAHDADIVLDLHCDEQAIPHIYMGTSLWPAAADLAAQMGIRVTLLANESGGDPFDEACSKIWWKLAKKFPGYPIPLACLAATIELGGYLDVDHAKAAVDAENIFHFLKRRGFILGPVPALPALPGRASPLKAVEFVKAPEAGTVVYLKFPGDQLKAGEVIAHILNPLGGQEKERIRMVKTPIAGLLFAMRLSRQVRAGSIIAKIAGQKILKGKGKNLLTV